ncbi:MAG: hypothetical protein ABI881_12820 [Betaproteobacteria bacterium]
MAAFVIAAAVAAPPAQVRSGVLVGPDDMTLYTYDEDAPNRSHCSGGCLAAWPAFVPSQHAARSGEFSVITRGDGGRQVARNGKPLYYYYTADRNPGDIAGDNSGGVWHAVRVVGTPATATVSPPAAWATGYRY